MNKRIGIVLVIVFLAAVGVMKLYDIIFTDDKGPVIEFSNAELVYSEGQDEKLLLADVTAVDDEDGDVSKTLMIAKKVVLTGGNIMKVQYAAKDKSNNITIKERVVPYKPSENSKNNGEDNPQKPNENTSDENSDSSENTDNSSNSENTTGQGTVDNDPTGEIDKAKANATGIPVIKLNATEATITEGQTFNALNYVKETYDNSGDVSRRIRTIGEENINGPGDYELIYSVSDTQGNVSEPVKFILHVLPRQTQQQGNNTPNQNQPQSGNNNQTQNNPQNTNNNQNTNNPQ